MKINRLFEIVAILLNKGTVTAKELADRFEVSTRTIYRDIDALSSAGVPIYTNKGNKGGISLLDNYTINRTLLSQKDSEGLLLTLKTLQAAKYPDIQVVMDKLASLFKNVNAEDWVEIDFSDGGTNSDSIKKFNEIKQAILRNQSVKFTYFNSYCEKTIRSIDPLKLIFKGKSWYIWGYCHNKKDFRLFKINRMKEFEVIENFFDRKELSQKENYQYQIKTPTSKEKVNLTLKFQPSVVYLLYDYFDEKDLSINDDGTYELEAAFYENEWIYSFLMSFGENVEVIEPEYIREELIKRLENGMKNYGKFTCS